MQGFQVPKSRRMAGSDEFPEFHDGDVRIEAPTGQSWKLHSYILRRASEEFKKLLEDNPARRPSKRQKADGHPVLWKFNMVIADADERFVVFRASVSMHRGLCEIAG